MKKAFLLILAAFAVLSCKQEIDPEIPESTGVYVLNNGSWGLNDSSAGIYDTKTKVLSANVFSAVNGQALGDLAQDIFVDGEYVYIAVNGSKIIFVTDRNLKILRTITVSANGSSLSPRYFTAGGGKIYVTYYEGYLGEITPDSWTVRTTPVGANPEGLAYCGGAVYVANSGGLNYPEYDNTVSVVDAASFKETSKITVQVNPNLVKACGDNVFVSSFGDYAMEPAKVQCINTKTSQVTDLNYSNPSSIALYGDDLFILCGGYDEMWNPLPGKVYKHNARTNTEAGAFTAEVVPAAYSLSATSGYVWVGASDYVNTGDVYVFDRATGALYDKFDSAGLNPICVAE